MVKVCIGQTLPVAPFTSAYTRASPPLGGRRLASRRPHPQEAQTGHSPTRPAEYSDAAGRPLQGKLTSTRRDFIRGVAAAGASTAGPVTMNGAASHLFAEDAQAGLAPNAFSDFEAIAASSADVFEVAPGFRADVLISHATSSAMAIAAACATATTTTSWPTSRCGAAERVCCS